MRTDSLWLIKQGGKKEMIERIQNNILRTILAAPKTTLIKEMLCELDLSQLDTRRTWLTRRYIFRVKKPERTPVHNCCREIRSQPKPWKEKNTPSLKIAMNHTIQADIELFPNKPRKVPAKSRKTLMDRTSNLSQLLPNVKESCN
jgi:hypothetical protein